MAFPLENLKCDLKIPDPDQTNTPQNLQKWEDISVWIMYYVNLFQLYILNTKPIWNF